MSRSDSQSHVTSLVSLSLSLFSYIKQPSLMLEWRSLIPTRTRRRRPRARLRVFRGWTAALPLPLLVLLLLLLLLPPLIRGIFPPPPPAVGDIIFVVVVVCCCCSSTAKTSTIHSYQTFRSSVCRNIVMTISPLSGTLSGVFTARRVSKRTSELRITTE